MKKLIFIFSIIYCLSSCWYSNGCVYTPQMVNCYKGEAYPNIAHWQKKISVGYTNSEQRWRDLLSCGFSKMSEVTYGSPRPYEAYNFPLTEEEIKEIDANSNKRKQCMYNKGYYLEINCGTQHPKWSTGKCNI